MRDHATFAMAPATSSAASRPLVPVEKDGDMPGVGMRQELQLLHRDRGAHQRHGRDSQAVKPDRGEVALDHHQVLAVLDPVQVEQLEILVETRRGARTCPSLREGLPAPTHRPA